MCRGFVLYPYWLRIQKIQKIGKVVEVALDEFIQDGFLELVFCCRDDAGGDLTSTQGFFYLMNLTETVGRDDQLAEIGGEVKPMDILVQPENLFVYMVIVLVEFQI